LRSGDHVRIIVKLIDGATDRHLWAEEFEREARDIITLQGEVASAVTRRVAAQLRQNSTFTPRASINPDAYDAYLKGRFFWNSSGKENLVRSVGYFEQAVGLEPEFAQGFAGLADAHNFLAAFEPGDRDGHYAKARNAAQRAVELAPDLADAHAALAFNSMYA